MKRSLIILLGVLVGAASGLRAEDTAQGKELCKQNYDAYMGLLRKGTDDAKTWAEFRACTDILKRWPDAGPSLPPGSNSRVATAGLSPRFQR